MIPELYSRLMIPHVNKVDEAVGPGLTIVTWTSVNIPAYVDSVYKAIAELELLVNRVVEIKHNRIDAALSEMTRMDLVGLPATDEDPITIQEFLNTTKVISWQHTCCVVDPCAVQCWFPKLTGILDFVNGLCN